MDLLPINFVHAHLFLKRYGAAWHGTYTTVKSLFASYTNIINRIHIVVLMWFNSISASYFFFVFSFALSRSRSLSLSLRFIRLHQTERVTHKQHHYWELYRSNLLNVPMVWIGCIYSGLPNSITFVAENKRKEKIKKVLLINRLWCKKSSNKNNNNKNNNKSSSSSSKKNQKYNHLNGTLIN